MKSRAVDSVQEEIAKEKAESFGRSARLLKQALAELADLPPEADPATRELATRRASERVLNVIVQREACGLRDASYVYRFYGVPREVVARIGIAEPHADRR
jgi:hypothetical protein